MAGESLSIRVPNPLFVEWLPKHYSVVLAEALRDVGRPDVKLVFVPDGAGPPEEPRPPASLTRTTPGIRDRRTKRRRRKTTRARRSAPAA